MKNILLCLIVFFSCHLSAQVPSDLPSDGLWGLSINGGVFVPKGCNSISETINKFEEKHRLLIGC